MLAHDEPTVTTQVDTIKVSVLGWQDIGPNLFARIDTSGCFDTIIGLVGVDVLRIELNTQPIWQQADEGLDVFKQQCMDSWLIYINK